MRGEQMSSQAVAKLKADIITTIKEKGGGVSMVELENSIPEFSGDYLFGNADMNIWWWFRCSIDACDALAELVREEKITAKPTDVLVYLIDGAVPQVPIAKQIKPYKKERWIPVVLNLPETAHAQRKNKTKKTQD